MQKGPPVLTGFFGQGVPAHRNVPPLPKVKPKAKAKPNASNPSVRSFLCQEVRVVMLLFLRAVGSNLAFLVDCILLL